MGVRVNVKRMLRWQWLVLIGMTLLLGLGIIWQVAYLRPTTGNLVLLRIHKAFNTNGSYYPTKSEVENWIRWIGEFSELDFIEVIWSDGTKETIPVEIFYCALIFAESTGDPTNKTDGGMSRGLMSVSVNAAKDYCKRNKIKNNNLAISLYNPQFNIMVGVGHYENLLEKWQSPKWACTFYNCGERQVAKWIAKGTRVKHSHYRRLCGKIKILQAKEKIRF